MATGFLQCVMAPGKYPLNGTPNSRRLLLTDKNGVGGYKDWEELIPADRWDSCSEQDMGGGEESSK